MMESLKMIDRKLELYKQHMHDPDPVWPHDIRDALTCLKEHIFVPGFSVERMKENCNISDHNFSSRFRNYTGMTPKKYITFHRVQVGKILFSYEPLQEIPVSSIGFKVGYEKPSSFAMIFKKMTGLSPSAWRKNKYEKRNVLQ